MYLKCRKFIDHIKLPSDALVVIANTVFSSSDKRSNKDISIRPGITRDSIVKA